jgi:endonuclease/exonuclease/phosphatase family metal-dependent hydrolase
VRLATWNVLNGTSLADGSVDGPRLGRAAATLGADVLGLQEVDRGQPRSHGLDLVGEVATGLGTAHWRFVPALIGTPGGSWRAAQTDDEAAAPVAYGVGLVSRHPVLSWHVLRLGAARVRSPILLPGSRQVVWLQDEPRVAVAAVVSAPGGLMTVASTHLSFVPGWNAVQLRRLTRWLHALPGPHVLLGDLNMPPLGVRAFSRWQVLGRQATYPSPEPRVQLDHVLGSAGLPPVVSVDAPVMPVSDHRPLVVELAAR